MDKIKSKFEYIRFPLIILILATIIKGIGVLLLNNNFINYFKIVNEHVFKIAHILNVFGNLIFFIFPVILALRYLNQKYKDERVPLMFIVSYVMFVATTTLLTSEGLPNIVYSNMFNVDLTALNLAEMNQTYSPLKTGFIGTILCVFIVRFSYEITRSRTDYSFLSFIDKDTLSTIIVIVLTFFVGYGFSMVWPIILKGLFGIFNWIMNDISNPVSLFVYGVIDKLGNILDLSTLSRESFWFSEFGGSWIDNFGNNFSGDVVIWNEQIKNGVFNTGFGRFITPIYISNMFIFPAIIISIYRADTDKFKRLKLLPLTILMIIISMFTNISVPIELYLLVMMPMVYVFHVFYTGVLFATLQASKIFLGASFSGFVETTSAGNLIDFVTLAANPELKRNVILILIVGLISAIIYYIILKLYYNKLSLGLVDQYRLDHHVDLLLEMIGGLDNIKLINSSALRIDVILKQPALFDYELLDDIGIDRAIETKTGFALYYGSSSTVIKNEIEHRKQLHDL